MKYGFIGCGNMGSAIAKAMASQGVDLAVTDRSGKAKALGFPYTDAADIILISDQLYTYSQSEPECYEEPTESLMDEDYKESVDTDDQHSIIADSGTSGTLKEGATGENYNGSSVTDDLYGVTSDSASTGYTITLTTDTGTQMEYYLSGNILLNRVTNQSRKLTQAEANTLKELLGIPNP